MQIGTLKEIQNLSIMHYDHRYTTLTLALLNHQFAHVVKLTSQLV